MADRGCTSMLLSEDGRYRGYIAVADAIRQESQPVLAELHALGVEASVLLTGDNRAAATAIAQQAGIRDVRAELLPAQKVDAVKELLDQYDVTAMVGDGINDAPALAHADVGIAIGTGTDVAIESADVVLMSGDLRGVVNAFEISTRTMRNIKQNLFWAFGYNVALIPVAAGVLYPVFGLLLSPVLAAGAMALSSVFVLTNALRLRRVRPAMDEADKVRPVATLSAAPAE